MNFRINKLAASAVDQTLMVAETVVGLSRSAAEGTAKVMHMARTPVRNVAMTSIKINDITHRGLTKLVKVQARAIERTVEAGAARFELAARAPTIRSLIKTQIELLPNSRKRIKGDLRDTWTVVTNTGAEFSELFNWNQPVTKAGRTIKRKAKAARKPRAKKAAASKKTAGRKKTRRTKVARTTAGRRRRAA